MSFNLHDATADFITDIDAFAAKVKAVLGPQTIKTVQNDFHVVESAAWTYIKANGLEDLYNLAMTLLAGPAGTAGWGDLLATLLKQTVTDGKQLTQGTIAIVAAQAQADGILKGAVAAPMATPAV